MISIVIFKILILILKIKINYHFIKDFRYLYEDHIEIFN